MSSVTIRNLDSSVKERLRIRAAEHGHSMEADARRILQAALKGPARAPASNPYERIRALVDPLGGIDLDLPPRDPARDPPRFDWMFVLDTNVISAVMPPANAPASRQRPPTS